MSKISAKIAGIVLCSLSLSTWAITPDDEVAIQSITPAQDYSDEFVRQRAAVTALGPSLFGDNTGLSTGGTEFATTDISLPGNNALPVSVSRRYRVDYRNTPLSAPAPGLFADWDLDLPHLHGTFPATAGNATSGWQVTTVGQPNQRCSVDPNNPLQAQPPGKDGSNGAFYFTYDTYWHGNSLYVPGQGEQTLMVIAPGNSNRPTDGRSYHWVSSNQWMVSCLPATANGVPGEGFLVVSPDGTKYWFDWFAKVNASGIYASGGAFPLSWASDLPRQEQYIFPTRIEDRFGNSVTYTYDAAQPMRLLSIQASDGRSIALTYNDAGRIGTATAASQTWTYTYTADNLNLQYVILPDTSRWTINFAQELPESGNFGWRNCADIYPPGTGGTAVKTITHPSGAVGTFTFRLVRHGRSYVPFNCRSLGDASSPAQSKYADVASLISKQISGPGIASPLVWSFNYGTIHASWTTECTSVPCPTTREVTVTEPDGSSKRHTFSNRFNVDEGKLLSTEVLTAASQVTQSETIDYQRNPAGQLYPAQWGTNPCTDCDHSVEVPIPFKSRVITHQGDTFSTTFSATITAFDQYSNPTAITRASSLGFSRSESTVYHNNTERWVLGQVKTVTEGSTGAVMQSNIYDPITATLTSTREFGQPATTMTYYPNGSLWTLADGANQTTTFSNYHRGLAQNVLFADGTSVSIDVNDRGQITSFTNAEGTGVPGYAIGYSYDEGGRLSKVIYPTGDTPPWAATTLSFVPVASTEYGLPAGHWKQVVSTGNGRRETYFDAMWRPVMSRVYDAANVANTQRMVQRRYDSQGHESFVSYPKASIASVTSAVDGVTTQYDPLGRVTDIFAASELVTGPLTTTIRYLDGFQKQVTNPRGYVTTTSFQAFDVPDESAPVSINAPLTSTTTIVRDVFGKPTSITRSGVYNGNTDTAVRRYVYDVNQRLCKTIEPESGATIQDYNTANKVAWMASGQNFPIATTCDRASVLANQKVTFGYDLLNRPTTTTFGDGSPTIVRTYTLDGLPKTVSADNSVWTTLYNYRRLPTSETLTLGTATFAIDYAYNANGHTSQMTYPDGTAIAYLPNALGEATQVGAYASLVKTHPNGALASFRYGNGINHTTAQNTRGLPSQSTDGSVVSDGYTYDENANVVGITDLALGGTFARTMVYDELDRLTSASNATLWGGAFGYEYDALDNLRRSTTPFLDWTHVMTAGTQRLDRIKNTAGGQNVLTYGYDTRGRVTTRSSKSAQIFTIDLANRVTAVSPSVATYKYDGLGHRTTITKNGTSIVQVYTPAGQLVFESSPSGSDLIFKSSFESIFIAPTASPTVAGDKRYIYLGRHLIAEDGSAGRKYLHTDGLGSPVAKTNTVGTILDRSYYVPYGWTTTTAQDGPGFTGHVTDTETGLSYMQARYYDPYAGRFMSTDPAGISGGGGNFNRYWYANNNPYKFIDPDGRFQSPPWLLATVPGQALFDNAMTSLENGSYGQAALFGTAMLTEQVLTAATLGTGGAVAGPATRAVASSETTQLAQRANQIHDVLDPIARSQRTTGVLKTDIGNLVAGGARDLIPAQRAMMAVGEIATKQVGTHAEITLLNAAQRMGATPEAMAVTRTICPACAAAIEAAGGKLTSEITAIWGK